jgi:TolA-binding protein
MFGLSRWRIILLALVLGVGQVFAATSDDERAFGIAMDKFHAHLWDSAEKDFADFLQKYPNSGRVSEAILYRAQSRFFSGQFSGAIDLLASGQNRTNKMAAQYLYWIGLAHFENKDYASAAAAFNELNRRYPESSKRLDALVREAWAFVRLQSWPRVIELLEQTDGAFQEAVRARATSETIALGYLLLGDAYLAQGNFDAVNTALQAMDKQPLSSDLKWQRRYLECRRDRAQGHLEDALQESTDLISTVNVTNRAEGVAFQAGVLEQLARLDAAVNAYTNNLTGDTPVEQQRQAILKIAELDLRQNKLPDTAQRLLSLLDQFPNSRVTDLAVLTLGEVRLKQALAGSDTNLTNGETNLFEKALERFDSVINTSTNGLLVGKAYLDKGWCLWSQGKVAESQDAFRTAVQRLPFSEEQAEARFKWADTQLQLKDVTGAINNYNYIATNYASLPQAKDRLIERALYQSMRAALDGGDTGSATGSLSNILSWYPNGFAGPSSLLLAGQGLAQRRDAAGARKLFAQFEELYPKHPLIPELRLAAGRTFEQEDNWEAAITNYSSWILTYTNHARMPEAKFSLAWANDKAGHETNAFMLFTNFIVQFPTNQLAAQAQWWLGDYYFRQQDYVSAEKNYQTVYQNTNWTPSQLSYEARMMAGRAAMARFKYKDAINYFTNLTSDLNCPGDLRAQATFAYADATVSQRDATNRVADLIEAIQSLQTILQSQGTNQIGVQALGKIGDCYFEWAGLRLQSPDQFTNAIKAYRAVIDAPASTIVARNQARYKLGTVLEKQAASKTGDEQAAMVRQALEEYVNVFFGKDLRGEEKRDPFWVKKAGMEAGRIAESLQEWQSAYCIYKKLRDLVPALAASCEKKMEKAQEHGAKPEC